MLMGAGIVSHLFLSQKSQLQNMLLCTRNRKILESPGFLARTVNGKGPYFLISLFWNALNFWFDNLQGYSSSVWDFPNGLCLDSRKDCHCLIGLKMQGWPKSTYQSPPGLLVCNSGRGHLWSVGLCEPEWPREAGLHQLALSGEIQ